MLLSTYKCFFFCMMKYCILLNLVIGTILLEAYSKRNVDDVGRLKGLDNRKPIVIDELETEHRKMEELVTSKGYSLEHHYVTTDDGYVLGVYRIPNGRNYDSNCSSFSVENTVGRNDWMKMDVDFVVLGTRVLRQLQKFMHFSLPLSLPSFSVSDEHKRGKDLIGKRPKPAVILQHGLLDSSATWVVNFPNESLGFILADAGFDVWMPNSRGTTFSRNHTGFSPSSSIFWDFTFSDMAEYDLPAVVDYVQKTNQGNKVAYVGHSQGFTIAIAALGSVKDSVAEKLKQRLSIIVGLGPAAFVRNVESIPLLLLARLEADELFAFLGQYEFLSAFSPETADFFGTFCKETPSACLSILTAICGYNSDNLNASRMGTYVSYAPSGTSVKNMAHWAQLVRQSKQRNEYLFRYFDYGNSCETVSGKPRNCNQRVYGTMEPPEYNFKNIKDIPVSLFTGGHDKLADMQDVDALLHSLPKATILEHNFLPSYEHLDFTWGINSAKNVYQDVLRLIQASVNN